MKYPNLNAYLEEKQITMQKFSAITGVSYSRLTAIRYIESPILDIDTIVKIWEGTKTSFQEGLTPWEYTNLPKFYNK